MLILTKSQCQAAISMPEAIEAAAKALAAYSAGQTEVPLRIHLRCPGGVALYMPGLVQGDQALGAKIVSVFGANPARGLPTITAAMVLQNPETGEPLALMEAGFLTALRTGAASGVATRYLARSNARHVLVFGAGVQARTQLEAVRAVREIHAAVIYDPQRGAAEQMAQEVRETGLSCEVSEGADADVQWADVIITATTATQPVLRGELIRPGTHVNAVGAYTPAMQELPEHLIVRADRVVCDTRIGALAEAGDLTVPLAKGVITQERVDSEVGDIVLGRVPGRLDDNELTVYKGVGLAALDLVTARVIYDQALQRGLGTQVDLLG